MNLPQFRASTRRRPSRQDAVEAIYATGHFLLTHDRLADAAGVFRKMILAVPRDERGWLGLGECHERRDQLLIAAELYGTGGVVAEPSVRCQLARARILAKDGRYADYEQCMESARQAAASLGDDDLIALVAGERRRMS